MKNRPTPLHILCALTILSAFLCYPSVILAHETNENENATITVNASLLNMSLSALKEAGVDTTTLNVKSIPITKLLWCIAKGKCRFTNTVTLTMANNGTAEIQSEDIEEIESFSDSAETKSEELLNKSSISCNALSYLTDDGKVIVEFQITTIETEYIKSEQDSGEQGSSREENIKNNSTLIISSRISLKPDTPTIAAVIKTKSNKEATLLIITAEIV